MTGRPQFFMPGVPEEGWAAEADRLKVEGRSRFVHSVVYREGDVVIEVVVGQCRQERKVTHSIRQNGDTRTRVERIGPASPYGSPVRAVVVRSESFEVYEIPDTPTAWPKVTLMSRALVLRMAPFADGSLQPPAQN